VAQTQNPKISWFFFAKENGLPPLRDGRGVLPSDIEASCCICTERFQSATITARISCVAVLRDGEMGIHLRLFP
jgi:hypothetical protein